MLLLNSLFDQKMAPPVLMQWHHKQDVEGGGGGGGLHQVTPLSGQHQTDILSAFKSCPPVI